MTVAHMIDHPRIHDFQLIKFKYDSEKGLWGEPTTKQIENRDSFKNILQLNGDRLLVIQETTAIVFDNEMNQLKQFRFNDIFDRQLWCRKVKWGLEKSNLLLSFYVEGHGLNR